MNKPIQVLEREREPIKKTQNEGNLEVKSLGTHTETRKASFTKKIQAKEEKFSGNEYMIEEMNKSVI